MSKTKEVVLKDYSNKKPFNNIPCSEGESLTPVVLTKEMKENLLQDGLDINNIETCRVPHSGMTYPVAYIQMRTAAIPSYTKMFNQDLRDFIKEKYHIADKKLVSLDAMIDALEDDDAVGFDPTGTNYFEERALLINAINMLIDDLNTQDEHMGQIIKLLAEGYNQKEVGQMVDLGKGKTQTHAFIKKTQKLAKEIYDEKYKK